MFDTVSVERHLKLNINHMKSVLLFICFIFSISVLSQNKQKTDSLKTLLRMSKDDSVQIKIMINLGEMLMFSNPDSSERYYDRAMDKAKKLNRKFEIAEISKNIGIIYSVRGNYDKAKELYDTALIIYKELNYKKGISGCYNNLGIVEWNLGAYEKATDYYLKSLKIYEEMNDLKGIARAYNNIGNLQQDQKNYKLALEYMEKSLEMREKLKDESGIADCENNIGIIYSKLLKYEDAKAYHLKSLKIREKTDNKVGILESKINLGMIFLDTKQNEKALEFFLNAQKLATELSDKSRFSLISYYIAKSYIAQSRTHEALQKANESLQFAGQTGSLLDQNNALQILTEIYEMKQDYRKSFEYAIAHKKMNDSIFNEESSKQIKQMEARYTSEKKQLEIDNLKKDKVIIDTKLAKKNEQVKKQRIAIYSFIFFLILITIFSILFIREYRAKTKSNNELVLKNAEISQKNEEITAQRDNLEQLFQELKVLHAEISKQKKDITDSIVYASRIQNAILPPLDIISSNFAENFVMFKPRDLVSGDFYWSKQIKNFFYIVAADSTGHGVPGAFMSMLGISLLNEIVGKRDVNPPAEILNELRRRIKKSLKQTGKDGEQKDGMDMAICVLDIETNILQYAGANNPLYIIRNNKETEQTELIEIKADRMPIGIYPKDNQDFTNHEIQLFENDKLYFFSDGYTSQFGGEKDETFKSKRLKEKLISLQKIPMSQQLAVLDETLEKWRGKWEQVDDILMIGIQI